MVVVPSRTGSNKVLYVRHYKTEIGGEESRTCRTFLWAFGDHLHYYDFGCWKPDQCTCTVCRNQPSSLNSAPSEIV
jgi:hypothetical protein